MSSVTAAVDSSTRYHEYIELVAQYTRLGALAASKNGRRARERRLQGDLRYFRNKAIESAELYATSVSEGVSGTAAGSAFEKNYKCGDTPELAMGDAGEDGEGRVQELRREHQAEYQHQEERPPTPSLLWELWKCTMHCANMIILTMMLLTALIAIIVLLG